MDNKKNISRRDFLTIGGITIGALATATVVKTVGDMSYVASEDYGGFYVRTHSIDNPPYSIDPALYTRKDGCDTAFTRSIESMMNLTLSQSRNIEEQRPGSDRLAYAFSDGASAFMHDMGCYNVEQTLHTTRQPSPYPRWDYEAEGYSVDDLTAIVKYVTKFYGAATVGVTETRERYFYSRMGGPVSLMGKEFLNDPGAMQAGIVPERMAEVVPDILASMEPETFKEMLLSAMEEVDPDVLPAMANPDIMANMSGEMLQQMLPQMMGTMDPAMMDQMMPVMMQYLDPTTLDPTLLMPAIDIQQMAIATATDVEFSDELDTPFYDGDKMIFPTSMNRIIAIGIEEDYELLHRYRGDMSVTGASIGDGYSRMATTGAKLATFIRSLGYNAVAMGNNTALSTPIGIDAGLGELGRNSLLISPKYGTRLRLAKVITDMPLNLDQPISFGVTEFCEVCGKCAEFCPSGSIPAGERTYESPESGQAGLLHWPVQGDGCLAFWAESGVGCSQCIRVCPFNKPEGWLHEATKILIGAKMGPLDSLLLNLDDTSGYGDKDGLDPNENPFWEIDDFMHIKETDR